MKRRRPSWLQLHPDDEGPLWGFVAAMGVLFLLAARCSPAIDEMLNPSSPPPPPAEVLR